MLQYLLAVQTQPKFLPLQFLEEIQAQPDLLVLLVLLDLRVMTVAMAVLDHKEVKVQRDQQDLRVLPVQRDQQVAQDRKVLFGKVIGLHQQHMRSMMQFITPLMNHHIFAYRLTLHPVLSYQQMLLIGAFWLLPETQDLLVQQVLRVQQALPEEQGVQVLLDLRVLLVQPDRRVIMEQTVRMVQMEQMVMTEQQEQPQGSEHLLLQPDLSV